MHFSSVCATFRLTIINNVFVAYSLLFQRSHIGKDYRWHRSNIHMVGMTPSTVPYTWRYFISTVSGLHHHYYHHCNWPLICRWGNWLRENLNSMFIVTWLTETRSCNVCVLK
jgi:hypothetical protein